MFGLEVNDSVVVEQRKVLEQALSTNPKTQKALQKLIRKVILEARSEVSSGIKFKNGDPRGAAQAVRSSVYKRILGANLNIYSSRKAHGTTSYEPPRHPSPRGGNRRARSGRTQQIMSYDALDRGFVLRWINDGTDGRSINFRSDSRRENIHRGSRGGNVEKYGKTVNTGNRGSIAARNFFGSAASSALSRAADNLANLIDTELEKMLNKTK